MKTDFPHILCINPWIHDFAAFDFWAKPLGLLYVASLLRESGIKISYIDCLDQFHTNEKQFVKTNWDGRGHYRKTSIDFIKTLAPFMENPAALPKISRTFSRYGIDPKWLVHDLQSLKRKSPPDLIFITSIMTYWASGVAETIATVKAIFPDIPLILGGIYATLCYDHARNYSGADIVIQGRAESKLADLLKKLIDFELALPNNAYKDINNLPFPALDLQSRLNYAPILTSRGCPFSCKYCASSFLEPRLERRSPENVFKEILHWHMIRGVKNFAFYDDALLIDSKNFAFPLMERIIQTNLQLWFHTPNAIHIRSVTKKTATLLFKSGFKTIRLGLETTDFSDERPYDVKVIASEFYRAVKALISVGFNSKQIGAYLLCGLPGQKLEEVKASMILVKKAGITPILAYYTPIPHTSLWTEAVKNSRFDIERHPVLTNNTLFPCVRSDQDIQKLLQLKNAVL